MSVPDKVRKHDSTRSSQLPLSPESLRNELLERAGFNKEKKIAVLKKVIASAEQDLDAVKQTPVTCRGRVTDVFTQVDYAARAKAREQLLDLIGMPREGEGKREPLVQVLPAPWMRLTLEAGQRPSDESPCITIDATQSDAGGEGVDDNVTPQVVDVKPDNIT